MNITRLRYERFHVSLLLGWLCAGSLLGLIVGRQMELDPSAMLIVAILALLLGGFRSRRWWALVMVFCAGCLLGSLRSSVVEAQYGQYEAIVGRTVELHGTMSGDAQVSSTGKQKLTLTAITIEGQSYVGEVFATVYGKESLKRGDTLLIHGTLREGFASYGAALASGKILKVSRGQDIVRDIRESFSESVRSVVIEPMASLGLGFVVGQRSTLPDTLDEQLKVVGLTHIVVASGYNLTILVRFVMRLLSRHSRYLAFIGSLAVILGFVLFSGLSPSMNRAVIVTVLGLLAWYVGRRFHPLLLIIYVAAVTALANPMYVWADLGWYLSFFAFAGILAVAPLVVKFLYRRRDPSSFEQLVVETMSAEIMALPLIAFAFGTIPVFGLIANVLVAPFIPAAMALTALTGLIGMASHFVASVIALPTNILIAYMIAVVEWLSDFPVAEASYEVAFGVVVAWYVTIMVICYMIKRKMKYDFYQRDNALEV